MASGWSIKAFGGVWAKQGHGSVVAMTEAHSQRLSWKMNSRQGWPGAGCRGLPDVFMVTSQLGKLPQGPRLWLGPFPGSCPQWSLTATPWRCSVGGLPQPHNLGSSGSGRSPPCSHSDHGHRAQQARSSHHTHSHPHRPCGPCPVGSLQSSHRCSPPARAHSGRSHSHSGCRTPLLEALRSQPGALVGGGQREKEAEALYPTLGASPSAAKGSSYWTLGWEWGESKNSHRKMLKQKAILF